MSNQYTKGARKWHVEGIPKIHLSISTKEQREALYNKLGYIPVTVTDDNQPGISFTVNLHLTKIKAGYGDRYYIECGTCGKRVSYLMYRFLEVDGKPAIQYGCRHCFKVNYISQQATKNDVDYNYLRINQIGRKLDPGFKIDNFFEYPICPFKPKYMKQVTYNKLRKEFNHHVNEALNKHLKMMGVMEKRYNRYIK